MTSAPETTKTANAEQTAYWNDVGGPTGVRYGDMLDLQLQGVGQDVVDAVRPGAGGAVLDVGCGCGATPLWLGRAVGPLGRALGLDLSRPMLEVARQLAAATDFLLDMGPLARVLPALDPAVREALAGDVREALSDYAGADGVRMPGAVWIVTGQA